MMAADQERTSLRARAASLVAIVGAIAAAVVTFGRLLYGADFIDEAFYAAVTYRFALGARPFVDEFDAHQTASLLTLPYMKAHLALFGNTTGILLSMRVLWAVLNALAAVLSFRFLRRVFPWRLALLAAAGAFTFMPYMIPAPSFNTLPLIFGSMAVSLIGAAVVDGSGPVPYVLAGCALALASFAYPTFSVAAVFAVGALWLITRSWRQPAWLLAGGLGAGVALFLPIAGYVRQAGPMIAYNREFARHLDWGGAERGMFPKFASLVADEVRIAARQAPVWLAAAIAVLQRLRRRVPPLLVVATIAALPLAGPAFRWPRDAGSLFACTTLLAVAAIVGLSAPAASPGTARQQAVRFTLWMGLASALVFAMTSSNGLSFLGFGGGLVLGPCLALLASRLQTAAWPSRARPVAPLAAVFAAACVLGFLVWFDVVGFYRDLAPAQLHARVRSGPHAGLFTTSENARESEGLWRAVNKVSGRDDRVFAYHGLPAGYLYSAAKPSPRSLWTRSLDRVSTPIVEADLGPIYERGSRPTIVIKNLGWPNRGVLEENSWLGYDPRVDSAEAFVEAGYRRVAQGATWELFTAETAP